MKKIIDPEGLCDHDLQIRRALSIIGKKGGSAKSKKKSEAARINGLQPCKPGKKRGRPKKMER